MEIPVYEYRRFVAMYRVDFVAPIKLPLFLVAMYDPVSDRIIKLSKTMYDDDLVAVIKL